MFLDYFGPANGILAATSCTILGFYLFAESWSWAEPWVIVLGYSLIGIGGMIYFQCCFKAQYAFPFVDPETKVVEYKHQTIIIAVATTLGDASVR
jgi:hypothetical protein